MLPLHYARMIFGPMYVLVTWSINSSELIVKFVSLLLSRIHPKTPFASSWNVTCNIVSSMAATIGVI